jgi:hypothetical protein
MKLMTHSDYCNDWILVLLLDIDLITWQVAFG